VAFLLKDMNSGLMEGQACPKAAALKIIDKRAKSVYIHKLH
jgi:hypothetical protein